MKTLEELIQELPLRKSLDEAHVRAVLGVCRKALPDLEKWNPVDQHGLLENAQKDIKRYCRESLAHAVAYSTLVAYHTQLVQHKALREALGDARATLAFDLQYYGGTHNFRIPSTHNVQPFGFQEQALHHYSTACDLWEHIRDAHNHIAYRRARIADVLVHLYHLRKLRRAQPPAQLISDALEHFAQAAAIANTDLKDKKTMGSIRAYLRWGLEAWSANNDPNAELFKTYRQKYAGILARD